MFKKLSIAWLLLATLTLLACAVTPAPALAQPPAAAGSAANDLQSRAPSLVMIIRHAEKPPKSVHSPDLTEAGRARADKMPTLFISTPEHPAAFPRPDFVFATALSEASHRPVETAMPTAKALHEKLNATYRGDENDQLAREILSGKYAGKVVLIFWHHGDIPALAGFFGVANPPRWESETYDQVWQMRWVNGVVQFSTAPESLMPGDSAK